MPRVNLYIRQEDWKRWQSIPNIPDFIHNVLAGKAGGDTVVKNVQVRTAKVIKTPEQAQNAVTAVPAKGVKLCKIHQTPLDSRGKCLQKGCKYA